MSRNLRILAHAQADVDTIFTWLARRSVSGAVAWYYAFRRAVDAIVNSPEACTEAPESGVLCRPLLQAFFKTRRGRTYRVVFELTDEAITLLRVRGPGQRPLRQRDIPSE